MRKYTVLMVLALAFSLIIGTLVSPSVRANVIQAEVNIDPDSLLLEERNHGRWITAYIGLPEGYDVNDIDVLSVTLQVLGVGVSGSRDDIQGNVLMVKFDRVFVRNILLSMTEHMSPHVKEEVTLEVIGTLYDGDTFRGSDTIKVFFTQP